MPTSRTQSRENRRPRVRFETWSALISCGYGYPKRTIGPESAAAKDCEPILTVARPQAPRHRLAESDVAGRHCRLDATIAYVTTLAMPEYPTDKQPNANSLSGPRFPSARDRERLDVHPSRRPGSDPASRESACAAAAIPVREGPHETEPMVRSTAPSAPTRRSRLRTYEHEYRHAAGRWKPPECARLSPLRDGAALVPNRRDLRGRVAVELGAPRARRTESGRTTSVPRFGRSHSAIRLRFQGMSTLVTKLSRSASS